MSRENIELLRQGYSAFNDGSPEGFIAMLDEAFVYRSRDELPGGGSFEGRGVFRDRLTALSEVYEEVRFKPEELIDAGDSVVVVVVRMHARGRTSGVTLEESISHVWRVRDGRALTLTVYSGRDEALEAIGLKGG